MVFPEDLRVNLDCYKFCNTTELIVAHNIGELLFLMIYRVVFDLDSRRRTHKKWVTMNTSDSAKHKRKYLNSQLAEEILSN